MPIINEVDRKIIELLMEDARKKRTDIAQSCGISSTAVQNRIKKMKQQGTIVKHTWNVNWPVFGYNIPVTIDINLKPEKEKEVHFLIAKKGIIMGIEHFLGVYGLSVFAYVKDNEELKELEWSLRQLEGVGHVKLHIWNRKKKEFTFNMSNEAQKQKDLDRVDVQIFKKLLEDPEKSFLKIAKEIGIAPITVQNRYKQMEEMGVLKPSIVVDYSHLGYPLKACFQITTSNVLDNKLVFKTIEETRNIFLVAETIGPCDVIALGLFKDLSEIKKVNRKLRTLPSVEKVVSSVNNAADFPFTREYNPLQIFDLEKVENLEGKMVAP